MKYSIEALAQAVSVSTNWKQVLRELGAPENSGANYWHIRRRAQAANLDTKHFNTPPKTNPSWSNYRKAESVLVLNASGARTKSCLLRRALIQSGVLYKCAVCELGPVWQEAPLVLEVDHINGNCLDNRKHNLRFLCPNCHAQRVTRGRKKRYPKVVGERPCETCGKSVPVPYRRLVAAQVFCSVACSSASQVVGAWPDDHELSLLVWELPVSVIAKRLGVSGVAVKKHCKRRGISTPTRGYWAKVAANKGV